MNPPPMPNENTKHSNPIKIFVKEMNLIAREIGLKSTYFANPHGLMN